MKLPSILLLLFLCSLIANAAEQTLSSTQAVAIAKIIATDKDYQVAKDYDLEHPVYSKEDKAWNFQYQKDRPGFPGGSFPIFQIRDPDGYILLGWLHSSGVGQPKFKLPPKFRKQISVILKDNK